MNRRPASLAGESCQIDLGAVDLRQHPVGEREQATARIGKADRPRLAHEEGRADAVLQILDLVRERADCVR